VKHVLTQNSTSLFDVNQSTDQAVLNAPLEKLFNRAHLTEAVRGFGLGLAEHLENYGGVATVRAHQTDLVREALLPRLRLLAAPNQQVLAPEQSIRQLAPNVTSLSKFHHQVTPSLPYATAALNESLPHLFNLSRTDWVDTTQALKLMNTRTFFTAPYSPIFTTNSLFNSQDYDASNKLSVR
jgi:hypothetical protein